MLNEACSRHEIHSLSTFLSFFIHFYQLFHQFSSFLGLQVDQNQQVDEDGTGTLSWEEFTQVVLLCQERLERLNRQDEAPMEAVWRGVLGYFDGFSMVF